jgi:hypothetical protein
MVQAPQIKRVVAPPVYRPQPVPKVLQKKSAIQPPPPQLLTSARKPVAPPVYRPLPVQRRETPGMPVNRSPQMGVLKKPVGPGANTRLIGPAVYRPQPTPKVLQKKDVRTGGVYPKSTVIQRAKDRDIKVGNVPVFAPREQSDQEVRDEAKPLIEKLEGYGLRLSQPRSLKAMRAQFHENQLEYPRRARPARQRNMLKIKSSSWLLDELEAFSEAAEYFAPILGQERLKSVRGSTPQEIVTIGKLVKDPDLGTTLAETFQKGRNITVYDKGLNQEGKEPDYGERLEAFVHELTHGLLEHRIFSFVAAVDYWATAEEPSGREGAEDPPNSVAEENAYEDMAESMMMFLTEDDFGDTYPQRAAICRRIIQEEFKSQEQARREQLAKLKKAGAKPALRVGGRRFAVRRKSK